MAAKFRLVSEHLYWWPVDVSMPDPEAAGKLMTMKFEARFKAVRESVLRAKGTEISQIDNPNERVAQEVEQLLDVITDWRGVVDENDAAVPFTKDALREAMEMQWFRTAVFRAWGDSMRTDVARRGN
ncbi:hypothetical protein [Tianweitania sediminis]|uniref:Uncharacterized protein n=1 Tax=Tianweitania sediminis TaxID=1502156 RepID=A0A8J7QZ44_9HYPH|nr:hypothetical protein [Tianweitania sediminis]MBP0439433.1 hypothetical protein [Tianweitania sediminis]